MESLDSQNIKAGGALRDPLASPSNFTGGENDWYTVHTGHMVQAGIWNGGRMVFLFLF